MTFQCTVNTRLKKIVVVAAKSKQYFPLLMAVYRFLSFAAPDPTFELELRIDSPTTHKDYGLNCSKLLQMFRTSYFGFELDKATVTKTALVLIEFEIRDWRWTRTKSLTIRHLY